MAVLKIGSTGDDVARIQQALQEAGFYQGAVDGIIGVGTEAAVKGFQLNAGLAVVSWARLPGGNSSRPRPRRPQRCRGAGLPLPGAHRIV